MGSGEIVGRCRVIGARPVGFDLLPAFVPDDELRAIEEWIADHFPWRHHRYGPLPPCAQYPLDAPIPDWAGRLGARMIALGVFDHTPGHVLLRRYDRGVGVHPHIDREAYGPVVAGLTLGSSRTFSLTRPRSRSRLDALLLPGDVYVLTGPARYRWYHSIPFAMDDEFGGRSFPRTDGFSVTWRYLPRTRVRRGWLETPFVGRRRTA